MRPSGAGQANSNRSGTTPAHDWRNYAEAIPWMIDRLRGVVIENRHAFEVMKTHDSTKTLRDWERVERKAFADGARERTEVLWIRNVSKTMLF